MLRRFAFSTATLCLFAGLAGAQTVNLSVTSSQDGMTVSAGATIDWTVSFTVSTGDNAGLALLSVDLSQDAGNPATLDLPPADGVPVAMENFSRPDGISNPGEGGETTGYIGVQRGSSGAYNLVQIGGGQNSFGQAFAPGTGVAENAVVDAGIGQSGAVILATGSFQAPATDGTYVFNAENAIANVFSAINTPPNFSPVVAASVNVTSGSFSFTVGAASCPGDTDGDLDVDVDDLLNVLGNFGVTAPGVAGDTDGDDDVDVDDLLNVLGNFGAFLLSSPSQN